MQKFSEYTNERKEKVVYHCTNDNTDFINKDGSDICPKCGSNKSTYVIDKNDVGAAEYKEILKNAINEGKEKKLTAEIAKEIFENFEDFKPGKPNRSDRIFVDGCCLDELNKLNKIVKVTSIEPESDETMIIIVKN